MLDDDTIKRLAELYFLRIDDSHRAFAKACYAEGQRDAQEREEFYITRTREAQQIAAAAQDRIERLLAEVERLRAFERGVIEAIPGPRYMDPPDGGDVTPLEQVRRMAAEVERLREALTEANAEAEHFKRLWHLFAASVDRLRRENMALRSLLDKPHIVLDKDSLDWMDAAGEAMRKEGGNEPTD